MRFLFLLDCKQVQSSLHHEERHLPVNTIESYQENTLPETHRENHKSPASDLNSRHVEEHDIKSLTTDDSLLESGSLEGTICIYSGYVHPLKLFTL